MEAQDDPSRPGRTAPKTSSRLPAAIKEQLQREILAAAEREQERIGYELHDGLGQHLTGLAFYAKALAERLRAQGLPEVEDAEQLVDLANLSVSMTRALARGLRPVGPEDNALTVALMQFSQDVCSLYRVQCSFVADETVLVRDSEASQHLFRIAQEAVNNAIKHGAARRLWIDLGARPKGGLVLTVRNDGKPLPSDVVQRRHADGMGLAGMRYRAQLIGARLTVRNVKTPEGPQVEVKVVYDAGSRNP